MGTFFGAEADGIFYVISLKVENKGKESKNIFTPRFKIIDNKGRSYDPDTEAEIYASSYYKHTFNLGDQLQPGLPVEGVKVFDLPSSAKGLKLEIRGIG